MALEGVGMGLTHVEVTVASPSNLRKAQKLSLLVDSGAVYSVVPQTILDPIRRELRPLPLVLG